MKTNQTNTIETRFLQTILAVNAQETIKKGEEDTTK